MDDQDLGERLRARLHERDEADVASGLWAAIQRRRRWDPWRRAGRVGLALVVVGLAVVLVPRVVDRREPTVDRPRDRVVPTVGWKLYRDQREGWQLRYPPGWTIAHSPTRPQPSIFLYPPGIRPAKGRYDADFYLDAQLDVMPRGERSDASASWAERRRPDGLVVQRGEQARSDWRSVTYTIPWPGGRWLTGTVGTHERALWARYGTLGEAILATLDRAGSAPTASVALPAVAPCLQALRFRLEFGGAPGPLTGYASGLVEPRAGGRCLDGAEVTASLQDGQGRRLAVDGNPATTTVTVDPSADPPILQPSGGWRWTNWCGGPGPFRFVVTIRGGGRTVGGHTVDLNYDPRGNGPACLDRGEPSKLAALARSELGP
jgi:hypothetical protein